MFHRISRSTTFCTFCLYRIHAKALGPLCHKSVHFICAPLWSRCAETITNCSTAATTSCGQTTIFCLAFFQALLSGAESAHCRCICNFSRHSQHTATLLPPNHNHGPCSHRRAVAHSPPSSPHPATAVAPPAPAHLKDSSIRVSLFEADSAFVLTKLRKRQQPTKKILRSTHFKSLRQIRT